MKHKQKLILAVAFLVAILCGAATNTPWDGTSWDVTAPDIDQPIGNHYKEMYDLRKGVALRINKEHETLAASSVGGVHVQGSARVWIQDATPALQPNGDALDAGDNGMIWIDTDSTPDNLFYVLTDFSDPTVGNGWTLISACQKELKRVSRRRFWRLFGQQGNPSPRRILHAAKSFEFFALDI